MESYQVRIEKARRAIAEAEYILLGGGTAMSAAAGLTTSGDRFTANFAPFIQRYELTDMYSSQFYPFSTHEERWAYWAKHISLNRYETGSTALYNEVYRLVKDRKHFVLTTNVDSQFEKAGFAANSIFEIQGNYGSIQCARACHSKRYPNERLVKNMVEHTVACRIPSEIVPKCPVCGGEMVPNIRLNPNFVQDETWYAAESRYKDFLLDSVGRKRVLLELGVEDAPPVRMMIDHARGRERNDDQTILFREDIQDVVSAILQKVG